MCNHESEGHYMMEQQAIESLGELMAEEHRISVLGSNDQLEQWMTKDGRIIDYRDLSVQHLRNIVNMLRRSASLTFCPRLIVEHRRRGLVPNEAEHES